MGTFVNGINVERFAKILAKRWRRDRSRRACDLSELNSLSGYSEALFPADQHEVCRAIERRARELFEQEGR